MNRFLLITLVVAIFALIISFKNYWDLKVLYCNLAEGFYAERQYTYPILRTIDDPDNYGKEYKNPITTEYADHCLEWPFKEKFFNKNK